MTETIKRRVEVGVILDVVEIKIHCNDEYMAQVLYDHIIEHFNAGNTIEISPTQKGKMRWPKSHKDA